MTPAEDAHAVVAEKFALLKTAVDEYFTAKETFNKLAHDEQCSDPMCPETTNAHGVISPESLSTFVVLAELTAVTENGTMTHTSRCFNGSAMACLGLITEAQTALVLQGSSF